MAVNVRKGTLGVAYALVANYNALRADATVLGTRFHADVTSTTTGDFSALAATPLTVTATNATTLPTSITLANQIRAFLLVQFVDPLAHKAADSTNFTTLNAVAVAVDLTTAQTLLNACKSTFNAHCAQAGVHYTNDGTNTVATANATDQASSNALANALKTAINAHIISAPAGASLKLVDP